LPVSRIKWGQVFNNGNDDAMSVKEKFLNRLCEFFVIDSAEDFHIWNLSKNLDKPAHVIKFGTKHDSDDKYRNLI
jgi:hypothetical protein